MTFDLDFAVVLHLDPVYLKFVGQSSWLWLGCTLGLYGRSGACATAGGLWRMRLDYTGWCNIE